MSAPSILFVGLPPGSPLIPPPEKGGIAPDVLRKALDHTVKETTQAGFECEGFFFNPDEMPKFETKLKNKHWDAVVIGFGVRGQPALTPYFEALVNTVRETDPGTKLGFNHSPDSTLEAVKRLFPTVQPIAV